MGYSKYEKINVDYLETIIYKSRMTAAELSVRMGRASSYLSQCKRRGNMHPNTAKLLCEMTDGDFDRLIVKVKENTPTPKQEAKDETIKAIVLLFERLERIEKKLDTLLEELK